MCGIAGLWGSEAARRVESMTRLLAHRGPDDSGVWVSDTGMLALGNRRLRIVDLSAGGHQPMVSSDGKRALTFNGEIYNHSVLRNELGAAGHTFRSRSDTEVLLAALSEWGVNALPRLNGMFAFAYWSESTGQLILARDRLGVKPLYYTIRGDALGFASEVGPLLRAGILVPELDPTHLQSYLRLLWVPEPGTLFRNVSKLEPGTYLTWDGSQAALSRYWDLPEQSAEPLPEAGQVLRRLLTDAAARQAVADVPVGAFLSGGVDSTAVAALAARGGDVTTYTIGFTAAHRREEGALDDLRFARLAASKLGLRHKEIILTPHVVDLLPKMVRHLEDPVADPAAINCYLICEAARATSTVLLSGTGADELFGGYHKYIGTAVGEAYRRLGGRWGRGVVEAVASRLPVAVSGVGLRPFRLAKRFFRYAGQESFARFAGYSCYYDSAELAGLLGQPSIAQDPNAGIHALREAWDRRNGDLVDRMTYVDLKYYLPGLGLAYMDRASMAASVEVRVPLLDDEVVQYAARLPGAQRVEGTRTKIAFREAIAEMVPREILNRPKAPFAAPVRSWLRRDLAPLVDDLLGPRRVADRGMLDPQFVQRLVREHRRGQEDHSLRLWALLTLEIWMQEFLDHSVKFTGSEVSPTVVAVQTEELV